jgi:hypothetical protein
MDLNELTKNPEQIQQLINILQAMLPKNETISDSSAVKNQIKTKSRKRISKSKTDSTNEDQQIYRNKFSDMPEFSMHKDDVAVDKLLNKHPPAARTRQSTTIEVTCRVCGKKERISSSLLMESASRYKCNNCSTQAG